MEDGSKDNRSEPFYDQGVPRSDDALVPFWLKCVYAVLPFVGFAMMYVFWDGSWGWFDRGAWHQLQEVANTTSMQITY